MIRLGGPSTFITSRGTTGTSEQQKRRRDTTEKWLAKIGLGHIPVYYAHGHEKVKVAIDQGCKVAWEDYPETVLDYANSGIYVFCPSYGYNLHVEHENVFKVEGWDR
jgi:hypothetical protein